MSKQDKLLPCPFCGFEEPAYQDRHWCPNCDARGPIDESAWGLSDEQAGHDPVLWNRRTDQRCAECEQLAKAKEQAIKAITLAQEAVDKLAAAQARIRVLEDALERIKRIAPPYPDGPNVNDYIEAYEIADAALNQRGGDE